MRRHDTLTKRPPVISVMVAVPNAPEAVAWYKRALGAVELWNLGSVVGLEIAGAPFFVGEPANNRWETPSKLGMTSTRIECSAMTRMPSSPVRSKLGRTGAWTRSAIMRCRGGRIGKVAFSIRSGTCGW